MAKSALHILLKNIADGDRQSLDKIVPKLADRLIVVPTVSKTDSDDGSKVSISVVTIKEGDRKLIPIFTSMNLLKSWLEKIEVQGEGLSMSGADIAISLGEGRWMMVDPGTDYWCEIEPTYVEKIAQYEIEDDWDDDFSEEVKADIPKTLQKTQEVPIVPHPITQAKLLNPSNLVSSFASPSFKTPSTSRLRTKDEDDERRATLDLTNLRKKFT